MRIGLVVLGITLSATFAHAGKPIDRAKRIVAAQIAALTNSDDSVIAKTFAPDAVVLITEGGAEQAKGGLSALKAGIAGSMHAFIKTAKLASLTAGGNDKVVWIGAEIELTLDQQTSETTVSTRKSTVRLTELAVLDGGGWKVVAAAIGPAAAIQRDKSPASPIEGATGGGGVLARMVAKPKSLATSLWAKPEVVVFGTDKGERAIGVAAGRRLLQSWASLALAVDGKPREVLTPTYGFIQANVSWAKPGGAPYRMRALIVGMPDSGGAWGPVIVHYLAP